jgi:hypothetical protein
MVCKHPIAGAATPYRDGKHWVHPSDVAVYSVEEASRLERLRAETQAYREAEARKRELRKLLPE